MAGDKEIQVTVTAGFISLPFSDVPESVFGWEKVLQIADMALYLGRQMAVTVLTAFRTCWCRLNARCLFWKPISRLQLRTVWWS
jgi:hypothetical protein